MDRVRLLIEHVAVADAVNGNLTPLHAPGIVPPMESGDAAPQIKTPLAARLVATALGAGYMPVAPGTAGTLVAVPLAWGAAHLGIWGYVLVLVGVTAIGIWAADVYEEATRAHDNQRIVIDEVVGYLVTLVAVPRDPFNLVVGFGLFRLFDTWKPWPVRLLDEKVRGGVGVVVDDIGAGIYAGLILFALHRLEIIRVLTSTLGAGQ